MKVNRIMPKRQNAKAPVAPVAPVIEDEVIEDEVIEDEMPSFEELLDQCEQAYLDAGGQMITRYCLCIDDLAYTILELNTGNRHRQQSYVKELADMMLTPLRDNRGQPIKGTTEWNFRNPIRVIIDDKNSLHNAQHSMDARLLAVKLWDENQAAVAAGNEVPVDYRLDYGIERELFDTMVLAVELEFPSECVDLIDKSKIRSTGDILYRQGLFSEFDFADLKGADDPKKLSGWYNEESQKLAMVLRFLNFRFVKNGAGPRGCSDKFPSPAAVRMQQDFATCKDSVHYVWHLLKTIGETPKAGEAMRKALNVPAQYLMFVHYLMSMSNAKKDKKTGEWIPQDTDWDKACEIISGLLLNDPELTKGHRLAASINAALRGSGVHQFIEGNRGLDARFFALGWLYRDLMGLTIDPKLVTIESICSGGAGFARYTDTPSGWDVIPTRAIPAAPLPGQAPTVPPVATSPAAPAGRRGLRPRAAE